MEKYGKKIRKWIKNYFPPIEIDDDYTLKLYLTNFLVVEVEPMGFKKDIVYGMVKDVFSMVQLL
jgi:5S rRNA maturation endonuclease (ribonuclease M5)